MSNFVKKLKDNRILNKLIWLFPVLYLYEVIMGFNGAQFTIKGMSIRIIFFCITVAVLGLYCLWIIYSSKMSLLKRKDSQPFFFDYLKPLDYVLLAFLFSNFIWATVIPITVRGEMKFSLKEFSTILVLVVYFLLVFLYRTGRLNFSTFEKLSYAFIIVLGVWHSVMFIGDEIHPGFYKGYYDFIDIISFGTAIRTNVIMGYGMTRIIQITSPLLILGTFMSMRYILKGKLVHYIPLSMFIFALCITYTKSLWFGFAAGLLVYLAGVVISKPDKKLLIRLGAMFLFIVVFIVALNFLVLENNVFERIYNSVNNDDAMENIDEVEEEDKLDIIGTQQANGLRSAQTGALLRKWLKNPLVGFGYGSYTEEVIRHRTYPFMYESIFPALVMKLGVFGCLSWVALIVAAIISAIKNWWKTNKIQLFWWVGMSIAFAMGIQTNPFLFTFSGFSMVLYILITTQIKDAE